MFSFTKQEKLVLLLFVFVVFSGSVMQVAFKKYPFLSDIVNLIDSDRIYPKINVNKATAQELVAIPYIGEYTAKNIIEYRKHNGLFSSLEQMKNIKGIRDKNFVRFSKYLIIE